MTNWLSKLKHHLKRTENWKEAKILKSPAHKKYNLNKYRKFYLSKNQQTNETATEHLKKLTGSFPYSFWVT